MAVARTEHGGAVEQRLGLDLAAGPQQVEALGEIGLREARIELDRELQRVGGFVVSSQQAQGAADDAMTEAVALVDRDRGPAGCKAASRRAGRSTGGSYNVRCTLT